MNKQTCSILSIWLPGNFKSSGEPALGPVTIWPNSRERDFAGVMEISLLRCAHDTIKYTQSVTPAYEGLYSPLRIRL